MINFEKSQPKSGTTARKASMAFDAFRLKGRQLSGFAGA